MISTLEQLKKHTKIVADTGDFISIKKYCPTDATTNPSLILAASKLPEYEGLISDAIKYAKSHAEDIKLQVDLAFDKLYVNFGAEILKIIPGRVSTEVDARLSFDREAQVRKALALVKLYESEANVPKERLLIKLSSTWEGIQAARELESHHGVHCNLTLMFCLAQAVAAAEAGATLISPFVGRILDWYKAREPAAKYCGLDDPGVKSVTDIHHYYKRHGHKTEIMGASFRNVDQILSLCGCDDLTISPKLLDDLSKMTQSVTVHLTLPAAADGDHAAPVAMTEARFRWELNEDEMASDKLAEGIRKFAADARQLETLIRGRLEAH